MIIAFDGRYAEGNLTGIGRYISNLASGLSKRDIQCVIFYSKRPKTEIVGRNILPVILPTLNRHIFEQIVIPKALIDYRADVYHAPANIGIPILCPTKSILTIHDIIPLTMKDFFVASKWPFLSRTSFIFQSLTSCWRANKIITLTNYVKEQVVERFRVDKRKITVINSGVQKLSDGGNLPRNVKAGKYILHHGGIDKRKNLDRLLVAFSLISKEIPNLNLVITGENPKFKSLLDGEVKKLNLVNSVIFTGYVNDKMLGKLLIKAACVCLPSLDEGFGAAALEGLASGVPVVASNAGSIPEIVGHAAILVDPRDVKGISMGIKKALTDRLTRERLIRNGLVRAKQYNWEKTVGETLEFYLTVLGK